jgi:hypothetical protein
MGAPSSGLRYCTDGNKRLRSSANWVPAWLPPETPERILLDVVDNQAVEHRRAETYPAPRLAAVRIAVDLTPLLPGGQNGGIKPLVMELLRDLIALAPHIEFVLLTSSATDAELATLDAPNVRRQCVVRPGEGRDDPPLDRTPIPLRRRVRLALTQLLPAPVMLRIELVYLALTGQQPKPASLPNALGANLLFSPFMTQSFYEPGLPSVSLVHDVHFLQ